MNTHTFYNELRAYLNNPSNTILRTNGYDVFYATTKRADKVILLNIDKFFSSDEGDMYSIEMTIYGTSNNYENLHNVMTSIRNSLDKTRNFLSGYKASYAFADGIMDDVVLQSVEGVNDRAVHAYFECTIRIEE